MSVGTVDRRQTRVSPPARQVRRREGLGSGADLLVMRQTQAAAPPTSKNGERRQAEVPPFRLVLDTARCARRYQSPRSRNGIVDKYSTNTITAK